MTAQKRLDLPYGDLPCLMLFLKERRDPVSHKLFRETTLRTEDLKDTVPFSLRLPAGYYGVLYDEKGTHILRGRFIRIHKEEARA